MTEPGEIRMILIIRYELTKFLESMGSFDEVTIYQRINSGIPGATGASHVQHG